MCASTMAMFQVPYALSEEHAASSTEEREARILNLGVRAGRTEFDLDVEVRSNITKSSFICRLPTS